MARPGAFAGRDDELTAITSLVSGTGGAVLVFEGDPGIGKSRLLDVLAEEAHLAACLVARSTGEDLLVDRPLGTLLHALASVAPVVGEDLPEVRWPEPSATTDPSATPRSGFVPAGVLDQLVDQVER